ncbi:MAG TPA: discoidin domain-containing protein [Polyangiaceae bacterium]|nr:discoidin domain-containing protein [Polyangiaceae bacterium]
MRAFANDRQLARKCLWLVRWIAAFPIACGGERATVELIDLRIEEIEGTRAVVRFETSLPTSGEVRFGASDEALDRTALDVAMEPGELSFTHEVPLEDLEPEAEYFWRARAVDRDNAVLLTEVDSFTTLDAAEPMPSADNVALPSAGAAVFDVSSNWGGGENDSTYGANHAFDGHMASEWASDGDGDGAWIELEFGGLRRITSFAFRSRHMADGSSSIRRVELAFDGDTERGPFDVPDATRRYLFSIEPPVEASRVRLKAVESTGGNTGAREIQFYE